jgi:membrane protease YdiL (CAAX protease family)
MGSTDVVTASLPVLKPLPLRVSIPLFAGSSLMFFLFLYFVLPRLWGSAVSEFTTFNVVLVLPMVLLLVASLVAYRLEGRDFQWSQFRDRFRLNSMTWHTWLWAIALAIFMYGGPYALPLSFALASAAVITEHRALFQRLKWLAGILGFTLASWLIWQCGSLFARIPLHAEPIYLRDFLSHFGPNDFMGISLHGRWWIGIYYFVVLLVANVGGEEFWWRGYLLPRQELSHGAAAWLVHGSLWALFHLFFQWTLQDLTHMLPTCCALAFVAQHRKNTWPGIIAHTLGNSALLIQIFHGVTS